MLYNDNLISIGKKFSSADAMYEHFTYAKSMTAHFPDTTEVVKARKRVIMILCLKKWMSSRFFSEYCIQQKKYEEARPILIELTSKLNQAEEASEWKAEKIQEIKAAAEKHLSELPDNREFNP